MTNKPRIKITLRISLLRLTSVPSGPGCGCIYSSGRAVPAKRASSRKRSIQIDGKALEVRERAAFERPLMGCAQHDAGRLACRQRLLPARGAEAPAVARLQPREPVFRHRRRQIIAPCLRE